MHLRSASLAPFLALLIPATAASFREGTVPAEIPMEVIAERELEARAPDGTVRTVTVRIGKPHPDPAPGGDWGCPVQIVGLDDDQVIVAYGYDAVQALQLAFQMVGARLAYPRTEEPVTLTWLDDPDLGFPVPQTPSDSTTLE
jgi:hypothetical protein